MLKTLMPPSMHANGKAKTMSKKGLFNWKKAGIAIALLLLAGGLGNTPAFADRLMVYAAASTTHAVSEIGEIFARQYQMRLAFSFAASSTLAKQIENGAPAHVFISANTKWMDYLEKQRQIDAGTRMDLLGNRLVLIAPADSAARPVRIQPGFDLAGMIGEGLLSMGDPDHVPAGIYGRQALFSLGLWKAVKRHVARSKDVRAALMLVERGEAPIGVVYATDAASRPKVQVVGTFPHTSHAPIVYPVAVVAGQRSAATDRFMTLLRAPETKTVFTKYGFSVH